MLLEILILMLLTLQVVVIEKVGAIGAVVVELVNVAVAVVEVVVSKFCLLVNWSSCVDILWGFKLNTQINSQFKLFWKSKCT